MPRSGWRRCEARSGCWRSPVVQRLRDRRPDRAIGLAWSTAGAWLLVNLPFAIAAPGAWWTFFRFNSERAADFDSLWYIACRHLEFCPTTRTVNLLSLASFLGLFAIVWVVKARREPSFPRWTLGFPMLVLFLVTNKVYSPQFGLWLLPWFALALPRIRPWLAFQVADVLVFVTRFWFFGRLAGVFGVSQGTFEAMVLMRAIVLAGCVVAWVRWHAEPLEIEARAAAEPVPAGRRAGLAGGPAGVSEVAGETSAPACATGSATASSCSSSVRVGLSVLSLISVGLIEPREGVPAVPGWAIGPVTYGWQAIVTATERQDAAWFLRIATGGYAAGDGSAAFFPLYPMAIKVLAWLPGVGPLGAALFISNACFLGALVLFHGLTRLEGMSAAVARTSVLLIAIFPTAFFFLAPYTESPFLLLSVSAFWFARRDRWAMAALMGALAALTRSIGLVLVLGLAVEAIQRTREDGRPLVPRLAASAAVAMVRRCTSFTGAWRTRTRWHRSRPRKHGNACSPCPWRPWCRRAGYALRYGSYWLIDALVVGVVLVAVLAGIRWLRWGYLAYALASLAVPLFEPLPDRPLLSMPRFVVVLFPAFWVMARAVERRRLPERPPGGELRGRLRPAGGALHQLVARVLMPADDRWRRAHNFCLAGLRRGPEPLGCAEPHGHGGACDDQGSHRGRPLAGAPGTPALPGHGRRHRGRRRGGERPGAADARSRTTTPEIALVDIRMPEMDGLEAAREIRDRSPRSASSCSPPTTTGSSWSRPCAAAPAGTS